MEANKDEAYRCINIAKKYISEGNKQKALKFLFKAEKLCPSEQAKKLIAAVEQPDDEPEDNGYNNFEHYEQSAKHGSNRSRSGSRSNGPRFDSSAPGPESPPSYTTEQLELVKNIRKCKDYYEILTLPKDFNEAQLKKSYRKLALQLHPDKNQAPGASEAFKAVGNAYAVLSDAEKKRRYDLYGPENENDNHRRASREHNRSEFESDLTPEEIFNMFFGGGFPSSQVYRRRQGNTFYYSNTRSTNRQQTEPQNEGSLSVLLQLLPFFILISISLLSSLLMGDPAFQLQRTDKYTVPRHTSDLNIGYYVQTDFVQKHGGNVYRIERQVESDYIDMLRNNCYKERIQKEQRLWQARTYGDSRAYDRAVNSKTPSCDKLQAIYA